MYRYGYSWKHYAALCVSAILGVVAIGSLSYGKTGHFVFQSSTSGYNLLLIANDKAVLNSIKDIYEEGYVTRWVRDKDIFNIENSDAVTVFEKDSIWRERAIKWVVEHPSQYAGMYVCRLISLYYNDTGMNGWLSVRSGVENNACVNLMGRVLKNIVYYLIFAIFVLTVVKKRKDMFSCKGTLLLILFLGTGITCLFSTASRYHYPFVFVILLWAAYGTDSYMRHREKIKVGYDE